MAVTVTSVIVKPLTTDPARTAGGAPDKTGHAGWANAYGDPSWIADVDWYRRYQLRCTGSAGEVGTIVNWEVLNPAVPTRTTAQINALADGTVGNLINNTTTWTIWSYTGVNVAGQAYKDTKTSPVCFLRANGPAVQVLLGPPRKIGDPSVTYTIGAFLPGGGKVPAGQTTQAVQARATYDQPTSISVSPASATITSPATTTTLTATVSPGTALQAVTWTTDKSTYVTVASATALTATVTAVGGAGNNGVTVVKAVAVGNSSIQSSGTNVTTASFLREGEEAPQAVEEPVEEQPKKGRHAKK
jgi:hypothetical protein